jgi:peroxiredoxin
MIELGQLESRWQDFESKNVRVVVVSVEGAEEAKATQADFPHLIVIADDGQGLTDAAAVLHPHSGRSGEDTSAPTTFLVDRTGTVRWAFRPDRVFTRLTPAELLAAIDREMPGE